MSSQVKYAFVGIAALVFAQQFVDLPWHNAFTTALNNALHIFLFTCITVLLRWALPNPPVAIILGLTLGLGIATEAAQRLTGGDPSWLDLGRDLVGIVIALPVLWKLDRVNVALVITVSILVTSVVPAVILASYYNREVRFPELYATSLWDRHWLTATNSKVTVTRGSPQLTHIEWSDRRWPSFKLVEPVSDWREYDNLVAIVVNPGPPQPITIGVGHKDWPGTARYVPKELAQGPNELIISLKELTQPRRGIRAEITHLDLYTTRDYAGRELMVDRIYLTQE